LLQLLRHTAQSWALPFNTAELTMFIYLWTNLS
jgi:hypothetical protein